jgi:hypothetical protein
VSGGHRNALSGLGPLVLTLLVCGCGSEGIARYELSGTVTYDGQPVPKGFVTITPDTSKGNEGPGGGAEIVDGKFRTPSGKGIIGGPHVVRIVGYDGVPTRMEGEELPDGKSLFPPYQANIDFPKQDSEHSFAIPKAE